MLIEDYAFVGDTHSAGLISKDGSIDWLCLPRFDSPACFAAILDPASGGHWRIAPESGDFTVSRSYRHESMVLETTFHTTEGSVLLIDCLPVTETDWQDPRSLLTNETVVRKVVGLEGSVRMSMEWRPRFDYGEVIPWLRREGDGFEAIGGPDALDLQASVPLAPDGATVSSSFTAAPDAPVLFITRYHESHLNPEPLHVLRDCDRLIEECDRFWQEWAGRCAYNGRWRAEVIRSLLVLKAMTYSPTGGIVAAPTTSLPEDIGGERNWDYRYCWLRDATFELDVLLAHGYQREASQWRDWLLRAVAGDPEDLQIMYGVRGERRLTEVELDWLAGYEGSRPVRVGNAAVEQFQLDVYGEVMDALYSSRRAGLGADEEAWRLQSNLVNFVCEHWNRPDEGIWEVRSGPQHFVHSKVMAWVAIDRGIKMVENFDVAGPLDHWRAVRSEIREEVLTRGYDRARGHFVRAYDDPSLDASLLMLPLVGFIEATDERMVRTVDAIQKELVTDGFVVRYRTDETTDGLKGDEGSFLMCSFWVVDCLELIGRRGEAQELFERLLGTLNDLGLMAEQYDWRLERQVGNFPQAFSHVALATAAMALERRGGWPEVRRGTSPEA